MITKYAMMGMGGFIFILLIKIGFMHYNINNLEDEIELLRAKHIACEISQKGMEDSIIKQNSSIKNFKRILDQKDQDLQNVSRINKLLSGDLVIKRKQIEQVHHETCEETVNWMLEEALNINEEIDNLDIH